MLTESAKDNERNEESQRITAQNNQIKYYGGRKRQLIVGKTVMIRSYTDKQKKRWEKARIIKKMGKNTFNCEA